GNPCYTVTENSTNDPELFGDGATRSTDVGAYVEGNKDRCCYTTATPSMPSPNELLGLVIVIFIIWLVLKLARVAIRLILFVITVVVILGGFYWVVVR